MIDLDCGAAGRVSAAAVLLLGTSERRSDDPHARQERLPGGVLRSTWDDGVVLDLVHTIDAGRHHLQVRVTAGAAPLHLNTAGIRLRQPGNSRILVDGYHSWDWAGLRDATRAGSGWWGAIWGAPGRTPLAVGPASVPEVAALRLRWHAGELRALAVSPPSQSGDRTGLPQMLQPALQPGETLILDPISVAALDGRDPAGAILPRSARATAPRLAGWMSWNCLGFRVSEADLLAAVPLVPDGGVILLDDGWAWHWGDWDPAASHIGGGIAQTAAALHVQRRRLGLWLAPFLVDPESQTAREHPEWMLRDERGRLMLDRRPARAQLILDTSKAEVREHLRAVGRSLGGAGVDVLKLDFLYAGATAGRRAPGWTGMRTLRAGVSALVEGFRGVAGAAAPVLACGAPAPLMVGLADSCRSGGDAVTMVPTRHTVPRGLFLHNRALLDAQIRNAAARAWLWGTTLPPDPDAITLGRVGVTRATPAAEAERWLELLRRCGGPVLDSDLPARVPAARRAQLERLFRAAQGAAASPERSADPLAGEPVAPSVDVFAAPPAAPAAGAPGI